MLPRSPTTTTLPTNLYLPSQRPFQLPASYHHQTHPDNQFPPHMGFENPALYHHHTVPSMDPSSVDFRAFYPYTPNEVKHRKRTTSAQLKILESIFKRDTKPNATLRNELASQLDMTARGVQVWFQNRRAKEKIKASKAASGKAMTSDKDESPSPSQPRDKELSPESPSDNQRSPFHRDISELGEASSQESSPVGNSPPQLHVITNACRNTSWPNSAVEPHSQLHHFSEVSLLAYRRGSLPVNVFPQPDYSTDGPPSVDVFDPRARRRSVDASLHRLASNPYAHLARVKNGMIFGTRFSAQNRHQRTPYSAHPHSRSGLTGAQHDLRRSSMDARAFRFSPSGVSPSPSPLSPYHSVRASLPEHNLYAITSRNISSPIPGPLPSPDFSFGAASTSSMTSPSSADSERNSPDSLRSFNFRGDDHDTDDGTSASYDAFSRFGSIASISTSESSVNSAYYSEVGGCMADHELETDVNNAGRRDSCASGHFLGLMSGLDVNGMPHPNPSDAHSGQGTYSPHNAGIASVLDGTDVVSANTSSDDTSAYPSPTSTISPGDSPHAQDALSSSVPISRSSELAFALHSQSDQIPGNRLEGNNISYTQQPSPTSTEVGSANTPPDNVPYFYVQQSEHGQQPMSLNSSTSSLHHQYGSECNPVTSQGNYTPAYTPIGDNYSVENHGDLSVHQNNMEFGRCAPLADVYNNYGGAIDPCTVSSMDNGLQNVESFISYS